MPHQLVHGVFPDFSHDEHARQEFVLRLREYVAGDIAGGNRRAWDHAVEPAFVRTHGRAPATRVEARRAMEENSFHQSWSALNRTTQEMIWASVQDGIDRQSDDINRRARVRAKKGSLRLNPQVSAPRYQTAVDIHCMPGNYEIEYEPDDAYQGALYDRGAFMYSRGLRGPLHDAYGSELAVYLKEVHPGFRPEKALDMGCSMGASTCALATALPGTEVHAIDFAAPLLRYGHARAESLGIAVHFSQQNAESTDFPDESFDLVFSCILMHETSAKALPNYLRESWRLLKPGGVALHMDFPRNEGKTAFEQAMVDWSTHYNAEPFIGTLGDTDLAKVAVAAGFSHNAVSVVPLDRYVPASRLHVLDARKPA